MAKKVAKKKTATKGKATKKPAPAKATKVLRHCSDHAEFNDKCHDCYDAEFRTKKTAARKAEPEPEPKSAARVLADVLVPPAPPEPEPVRKALSDLTGEDLDILDAANFMDLCAEHRAISDQIAGLEKRKKELSAEIEPLMEAIACDSLDGGDWVAVRSRGKSTTLKKELLLQKGVTMATINACTVTREYTYVQVRKPETGKGTNGAFEE